MTHINLLDFFIANSMKSFIQDPQVNFLQITSELLENLVEMFLSTTCIVIGLACSYIQLNVIRCKNV